MPAGPDLVVGPGADHRACGHDELDEQGGGVGLGVRGEHRDEIAGQTGEGGGGGRVGPTIDISGGAVGAVDGA